MILPNDLRKIARARLKDAEVLLASRRYDGAIYLCGYAVELALKARICRTLKWQGYPSTSREFRDYQSFRTHDLDVLLHLSGRSVVAQWNPSARYEPVGKAKRTDTQLMISAAKTLLGKI